MSGPASRSVVLSREELHEKIWAKPVRAVAAEFGISDVGLKKICERHDIPRPSPSHWGLIRHGRTPPKVPLPPRKESIPERIEIRSSTPRAGTLPAEIEIPSVAVPTVLEKAHAVVRALRKLLGDRPGPDGMLVVPGEYGGIVRTSPRQRTRALILLDCLFKSLMSRGHEIVLDDPQPRRAGYAIAVVVGGTKVELKLVERLRQTDHVPTVTELAEKARYGHVYAPKYDQAPSGLFTLTAGDRFGAKRTWAEKEGRTLDGLLGEVIVWMEGAAPVLREKERAVDERNRQWQLYARRSEHERFLVEKLHKTMGAWSEATQIRRFLDAIDREIAAEIRQTPELAAFVAWRGARADALDPLRRPEELAKDVDAGAARVPAGGGRGGRAARRGELPRKPSVQLNWGCPIKADWVARRAEGRLQTASRATAIQVAHQGCPSTGAVFTPGTCATS